MCPVPESPAASPDRTIPSSLGFASQSVHSGNQVDAASRAVLPPLVMANSYRLSPEPADTDWEDFDTELYTRTTGSNQLALGRKLAALEGGEDAVVLATGVAALYAVFFTYLSTGDHVVVSDVTYEATWRLFTELLPQKYGIEATFVDTGDLDGVAAAFRPNTRLLITETIANPTTRVADIAALAQIAHSRDALLVVDSTFTPPPLYRPLNDGADLVVQSLTKYINGHGDALGGAVIGARDLVEPLKRDAMVDAGAAISPFNAWMINRGSMTLPLRMRQHLASAQVVAEFLASDPRVAYVAYPGLPQHPQHDLARRLFGGRGFGATMAFAVAGDHEAQNSMVGALRLITSAVSLGHPESLIVHVAGDGPRTATYPPEFREYGHLRLAIGLEEPADLIADLDQALKAATGFSGGAR